MVDILRKQLSGLVISLFFLYLVEAVHENDFLGGLFHQKFSTTRFFLKNVKQP